MEEQSKIIKRTDSYDFLSGLYHYLKPSIYCDECSTIEHPIQMVSYSEMDFECPLCCKKVWLIIDSVFNFGNHYSGDCEKCKTLEKKGITFGSKK